MKYIVLLRGINISGKNKISMSELKVVLSKYYEDVITYINSCNIILNSNKTESDIIIDINMINNNKFNLDIPIFVIKYEDLVDILDNSPDWWGTSDKKITGEKKLWMRTIRSTIVVEFLDTFFSQQLHLLEY